MSVMMNPVLPVPGPEKMLQNIERHDNTDNSFAGHLDRRLDEKTANRDKLGVADRNETSSGTTDRARTRRQEDESASKVTDRKKEEEDNSAAALLAQFMQELQDVAEQPGGPGKWNLELPDMEALKKLAADAGMNEMETAGFLQHFAESDTKINLTDFFADLQQYFAEFEETSAITIPEAELPMLEAVLSKMGLPQDVLDQLSEQAVNRDGVLDLTEFFQGLEDIADDESYNFTELTPVDLSDWEVEQLQNILDQAGVTLEKQNELLPERFLDQVLGRADGQEQPVTMTLDRLKNIIKQGINEVRANEPELDLPSFLKDLQKIVSQSAFENESAGWTPVVQQTIDTVFQKLQEIVDMTTVKVAENKSLEEMALEADFSDWVEARAEKFADLGEQGADFAESPFAGSQNDEITYSSKTVLFQHNSTSLPVDSQHTQAVAEPTGGIRHQPIPHRFQQQVLQQLSAGVMRGLKNQEHHLVLRLYPQDMGEVKVDLTVHDEQVSVTFNMENSRVKEMLESNMDDFKDSMNRQGFTLGECSVSVGYQGNENNGDLWQRFVMHQEGMTGNRETLADLPDDALYHHDSSAGSYDGSENSISLMV